MKRFKTSYLAAFMLCIIVFAICDQITISQEKINDAPFNGFAEYVEKVMKDWKVPGMAIGVVKDGEVIYLEGFGCRDIENKLPVTPQTLFRIGSCTKAFTAMAVGMLIEEKKLDWNRPIKDCIPDFKLYDDVATQHATPLDLLLHRTGMPGHNKIFEISAFNREEIFKRLQFLKPRYPFRQRSFYSNLNYVIAGHLVERIEGNSYEESVAKRIFTPLGMDNSYFPTNGKFEGKNIARPYLGNLEHFDSAPLLIALSVNPITTPAGGIISNAEDMTKWIKLHLNKGKIGDDQLISARNLRRMHSPYMGRILNEDRYDPVYSYGMGWIIRFHRGHYLVQHGGQVDGYMANVSFMPFENIGVVVLTNLYYNHLPTLVSYKVYERILGLPESKLSDKWLNDVKDFSQNFLKSINAFWSERKKSTKPTHPLEEYAGIYEHPGYGRIKIEVERDELIANLNERIVLILKHYSYNIFATDVKGYTYSRMKFHFHLNNDGSIESLSIPLQRGIEDIVFSKKPDETSKK